MYAYAVLVINYNGVVIGINFGVHQPGRLGLVYYRGFYYSGFF